jgi:hypothetical protein
MPSPFPGMDPYLEHPRTWTNLHHRLITAIAIAIAPQVRPKYRVVVEESMYQTNGQDSVLIGMPDVAVVNRQSTRSTGTAVALQLPTQPLSVTLPIVQTIRQGYLEIREIATDAVVTVLEVLSPVNKRSGRGRTDYLAKRELVLGSETHWVEIDLLRQWEPMPIEGQAVVSNYRILVSESSDRPRADLYAFNVMDQIPVFGLPLGVGDGSVAVDLRALLDGIYEQSGYDLVIDYGEPPVPPLSAGEMDWAEGWLRSLGLRI